MLAIDHDVERCVGWRVRWRRHRNARALAGAIRLGHLRLSGAGGENVGRHGSGAGFDDEVEAVGEEGAKHKLHIFLRGFGRNFGADVEAVALEPGGAALHVDGIDAVGRGDEIEHGGLGEEVAIALNGVAVHERIGGEGTGVDIGDEEGL